MAKAEKTVIKNFEELGIEDDLNFTFDADEIPSEPGNEEKEPETLIEAFDTILENAHRSELGDEFFNNCAKSFAYLKKQLGLTEIQCLVIAMLADAGKTLNWKQMASFVGVSRLSFMRYYDQLEDLVNKRWLQHGASRNRDGENEFYEGYTLMYGVVTSLRKNEVFVPENLHCNDTQELVERLSKHLRHNIVGTDRNFEDVEKWIESFMKENIHLPLAEVCSNLDCIHDMALLSLVVSNYVLCCSKDHEGLDMDRVDRLFPDDFDPNMPTMMRDDLRDGTHELMMCGLIEHKCEDGMANTEMYVLTDKAKTELLKGFVKKNHRKVSYLNNMPGLMPCKKIKAKTLFYNTEEQEHVSRLGNLLSKEQFATIQERLESKGMRKGFACLFYGGPGTGKTATAYELARQTGRDIISVSVTQFMDKYVGESERKLREIFDCYREYCKGKKVMPILLMNEADAIISKRIENIQHSVDQMTNSLQNILLEEIENLDGILIATTNLSNNMDSAFERRFLFKIEFHKPEVETRAKIWKSMINELSDDDTIRLAQKYDFSGGEMENISRKSVVDYILNGNAPTFEQVDRFCSQERINNRKDMKPIFGFAV